VSGYTSAAWCPALQPWLASLTRLACAILGHVGAFLAWLRTSILVSLPVLRDTLNHAPHDRKDYSGSDAKQESDEEVHTFKDRIACSRFVEAAHFLKRALKKSRFWESQGFYC